MLIGIDVSEWQGTVNFSCVKKDSVDFVILKAGGSDAGFYTDARFEENYAKAKAVGLHVGAYYFVGSNFKTSADGVADAKRFLRILQGKQLDMPVYVDVESTRPEDKHGVTNAVIAFCETMEKAGYYVGIYASAISGFVDRLDTDRLKMYTFWVAQYSKNRPTYPSGYGMWQYTSTGTISGISTNVDMDLCYNDFPNTIIKYKMNGYGDKTKTNTQLALEVINGEWGNGKEREEALKKAGYDYDAIQTIVNELMY